MCAITKRFLLGWRSAITIAALVPVPAHVAIAQEYPSKPIRIIVAFPPGGGTDAVARMMSPKLAENLGPVVIDNRGGASGIIGTEIAAKAAPDGYTMLMGTLGNLSVNPLLFKKLPFDIARDFDPVMRVVNVTFALYVHPSLPAKNVKEFIALAKSRQLNYASSGNAGAPHLAAELFNSTAKVKMIHVPFKGGGPAFTALMGGHVDLFFSNIPSGLANARAGKLRILGVLTPKRSPLLPDVPAIAETLPGYEILNWFGIVVPAGTAQPIVKKLHAALKKTLSDPEVTDRLLEQGAEPVASSPTEFGAFMKSETAKWARVIKQAHIRAE